MLRVAFFLVLFTLNAAVSASGQSSAAPDAQVIIHENALNAFLQAVGPLDGRDKFEAGGVKGDYKWSVRNARIEISTDKARFLADAMVDLGIMKYSSETVGDVAITYDGASNRVRVRILKAELDVYVHVKLLGKKTRITTIDLTKYYKPEFEFAGPQPVQETIEVELPDGSKKTIYIRNTDPKLVLQNDLILVTSRLQFSDKPPVKPASPTGER